MRTKHKALGIGAAAAVACAFAIPAFATAPGTATGEYVENGHKVTICHRTGSATNPYVVNTVDVAAIDGAGNNDHDNHNHVGNGPIGDIIPPVDGYNDGKNWQEPPFYYGWPSTAIPQNGDDCTKPWVQS